ncbi:MAG: DUF4115 domain-containing protein [Sneathiellaceae bacterium]
MSSERSRRIALLEQRTSKDLGFHDPDPDARGTGIYSGIGDVLRQARERRGLSLEEVAAHLRISESYLAAIERGRFTQLPGRSYVLGFLRSYGKFLDLNADKVIAQYKAEDDDNFARKQQLKFPTVRPEGRTPGLWLLPVVMIVAAIGYLGWYGWKTQLVTFEDIVPDVPARLLAEAPATDTASATDTAPTDTAPAMDTAGAAERARGESAMQTAALLDRRDGNGTPNGEMRLAGPGAARTGDAQPGTAPTGAGVADTGATGAAPADAQRTAGTAPADSGPVPGGAAEEPDLPPETDTADSTASAAPPPLPSDPRPQDPAGAADAAASGSRAGMAIASLPPAGAQAATVPPGRVFGNDDARVILRASADTWVQVEDAQRNLLLTRVLKAGDVYRAPNQPGLVLMTGNAGGLVVEVDGAAIPSLGPRGAVRRNVSLDPERLLDGSQLLN